MRSPAQAARSRCALAESQRRSARWLDRRCCPRRGRGVRARHLLHADRGAPGARRRRSSTSTLPAAFIALYVAFVLMAIVTSIALPLAARTSALDRVAESVGGGRAAASRPWCSSPARSGAKPIWGAWWTWDARLTLDAVPLVHLSLAYLVLRGAVEERGTARALLGGARHPRRAAHSVHPPERLPVPHAPSDADRAEAERAVAAAARCW